MRKAKFNDMEKINKIIDTAKESLKNDGVNQWQNGSPNLAKIAQQVSRSMGYVYEEDDEILAYAYLMEDYDPTYTSVRAQSKGVKPIVVHTFCVDKAKTGHGLGKRFFDEIIKVAKDKGFDSLWIDTHKDNFRMNGLIKKMGFTHTGTIYIDDNGNIVPRVAYELIL